MTEDIKAERDLKDQFAKELVTWSKEGKIPLSGNQDIRYFLELQKQRLEDRGLQLEYELEEPKVEGYNSGGRSGIAGKKSKKYDSFIGFHNYTRKVNIYKDGKKKFSQKEQDILYVTTTWLKQEETTGEESYCCPDCGAISTVKELQEGCPYCKTRFQMTDLFPKVTDYFYVEEVTKRETLKRDVILAFVIGALAGLLFALTREHDAGLAGVIRLSIAGVILGALFGYAVWVFGKIGGILFKAVGSMSPMVEQSDAKKRLTALLGGFDPSFSYDYFLNQLFTDLKIILFAKDRSNLVVYEGKDLHPEFDTIIDGITNGRVKLNYYNVKDGYCTINMNLGMKNIHEKGQRIFQKNDLFNLTLVKNVMKMEEMGFSIKKVQCKSCGGSFDATKERTCPFCGAPYDMKEDGWVVVDIRQIK